MAALVVDLQLRRQVEEGLPRQSARQAGASAVALSGAGPSLIAFSRQPANPAIGLAMQRAFEQAGLTARIFPLNISQSGASVTENQVVKSL